MASGEPSEEPPKNRLEVLKENASRGGAGSCAAAGASGALLRSSSGLASSDVDTIALQRAVYLGKIGSLIARWRRGQRIARHRAGDVDALIIEAREPIGGGSRRRGSDRTAEREGRDVDASDGGEHAALPALGDARLPGEQ